MNTNVLELISSDVASISTLSVLRNILGHNVDIVLSFVGGHTQVNISWSNAYCHLFSIEGARVEDIIWEGVNEVPISIGLPVATDDWLSLDVTPGSFRDSVHHHSRARTLLIISTESTYRRFRCSN